ncbi:MAG TPA: HEAT repeat domain-containing protein [Bacteroidota bacterium]|nr:HEAT repeat domain-containing protein [Bacteroidota bacterium]
MKQYLCILFLSLCAVGLSFGQSAWSGITIAGSGNSYSLTLDQSAISASTLDGDGSFHEWSESGKKDDPGYKMYKAGYDLILDEKWAEARTKFSEMVKQFPKSDYVDDAQYWSAYAYEHSTKDRKKAYDVYKDFILAYPNSNYYDDAVAEMFKLDAGDVAMGKSGSNIFVSPRATTVTVDEKGGKYHESNGKGGFGFSYSTAPATPRTRAAARTINQLRHDMMRIRRPMTVGTPVPVPDATLSTSLAPLAMAAPRVWGVDEKLDPQTQLKMDALYALGDSPEDSLSFGTLHDVVVDPKQPLPLRQSAMDVLSDFKKYDVLNVFLEVAKKDTSETIQNMAIDYIGQISSDKDKSVGALIDLFSAIPSYRVEKQQTVLWSIGEIGNRRAVNFLAKVAKTNDNYALRSDAVHYLGSIGGNDAREALYEILKSK